VTPVEPVVLHRHAGAGDRLLLLHGLGGGARMWRGFLDHRPAGTDVWLADLPWRGGHEPSWAYHGDATVWVQRALAAVPGGAGVVVAHSFSSVLLLDLLAGRIAAGEDPVRGYGIRGLVLVSPFYRRRPESFTWPAFAYYLDNFVRIMEEGLRAVGSGRTGPDVRRLMAARVCERIGPYGWVRFVEAYLRTPWLRTGLLDLPALVVCGRDDFAVAPQEPAALAADLPRAELSALPDCGHFPMAEQPARFAAAVGGFLRRLAETTSSPLERV
jgi:pimeloyl-ACP methyl ester carboxylesterase